VPGRERSSPSSEEECCCKLRRRAEPWRRDPGARLSCKAAREGRADDRVVRYPCGASFDEVAGEPGESPPKFNLQVGVAVFDESELPRSPPACLAGGARAEGASESESESLILMFPCGARLALWAGGRKSSTSKGPTTSSLRSRRGMCWTTEGSRRFEGRRGLASSEEPSSSSLPWRMLAFTAAARAESDIRTSAKNNLLQKMTFGNISRVLMSTFDLLYHLQTGQFCNPKIFCNPSKGRLELDTLSVSA